MPILRGMDTESIDLIYLDPPFNSNKSYSAPVGSEAAGAAFKDAWTLDDVDEAWLEFIKSHYPKLQKMITAAGDIGGKGDKSYLIYMAVRLLEMRRILKPTGSIYLHCDPKMSHSLKLVIDIIFSKDNFRNEIIWSYRTGGSAKKHFSKKHDTILFYSKNSDYVFNTLKEKSYTKSKNKKPGIVNYGGGYAQFHSDENGVYTMVNMRDVWDISYINSQSNERTGYPTQKPLKLLDRIIRASSNENDIVLDPFCGCATTCVSAEMLKRRWIGIDVSEKAVELVKKRLRKELAIGSEESPTLFHKVINRTDIPARSIAAKRSRNIKTILYGEQKGNCNGCGHHFYLRNMQIDHIVPKAHGGQDEDNNLQLLCGACNSTKGTGTMAELLSRLNIQ